MKVADVVAERFVVLKDLSSAEGWAAYVCMDQTSMKMVVLKETPKAATQAAVLSRLEHPNLLRVQGSFETDGREFLVVEHAQGTPLGDKVAREGPFNEAQTLEVAGVLIGVYGYLAEHKVAWCGLSPQAIIRRKNGQLMLDCGLSTESRPTLDGLGTTLLALLGGVVTDPPLAKIIEQLASAADAKQQAGLEELKGLCVVPPAPAPRKSSPTSKSLRAKRLALPEQPPPAPPPPPSAAETAEPPIDDTVDTAASRKTVRDTDQHEAPDPKAPADDDTDLPTGTVLSDRFRIDKVLGVGGMGAVYLAFHQELGQPVAVKEMRLPPTDPRTREACLKQFKIEARILNRLHHPTLPRVYDFFQVGNRHYLVMDYIEGGNLDDAAPPSEAIVMQWAAELCDVLEYLHTQDPPVIFRDLKPSNIMLAGDGTVRLVDFGIAKVFEKDLGPSTKTVLQGFGTHGYAAPEQYRGGTDARVDIYALGATLYTLLTGLTPPPSMDIVLETAQLVPLREARPALSETLYNAVEWMMTPGYSQRPGSIAECRRALGLAASQAPVASTPRRIRQFLREEFHQFFPAPWYDHGDALKSVESALVQGLPAIAVVGQAGVGKSRLLAEMARRNGDDCVPTLVGTRLAKERPLGALLTCLQSLVEEQGETLLRVLRHQLSGPTQRELAPLFPMLQPPPGDDSALGASERSRLLLEGCRQMVEAMASLEREDRLLWCIDDAHLLDPATLRLLDAVLSQGLPMTVVLASEPDPESRWSKLPQVVLEPMTPLQVQAYLLASLPPVAQMPYNLLHQVTGGNVRHLEELVRCLVVRRFVEETQGTLRVRPLRADQLPATLLEAVRVRMELLAVETREVLSKAAVIGPRFDMSQLATLSGETVDDLQNILRGAAEAIFVRKIGLERWEFVSDAAHQAFYGRLGPQQCQHLHRAMGQLDAKAHPLLSNQAYHYGQAGDVEKSLLALTDLSKELLASTHIEAVVRDGPGAKVWATVTELSDERLTRMTQAFSAMGRSLKSLSHYGPDSPVVQTSFDTLMVSLVQLQIDLGPLLVKCSEHYYSLNGREADVRLVPPELAIACKRHRISGFEIRPGLDITELTRFLQLLNSSHDVITREGGWETVFKARQITTIQVIENVLVEVSERDLYDPLKVRPDISVKAEAEGDSEALVSNREVGAQLESIRDMLEKVRSGGSGAPLASDAEMEEHWGWISKQISRDEFVRLVELFRMVDRPLLEYLDARPEQFLADAESPERERRVGAAMGLLRAGARVKGMLLNYLATSDHVTGRAVVLFVLGKLVDNPGALITDHVLHSFEEQEVVRLLRALRDGRHPWSDVLEMLLMSAFGGVRLAASRALVDSSLDPAVKVEILRQTLKTDSIPVVQDTLRAIADLRNPDLVPDVGRILDRGWGKASQDGIKAQIQACYTLGRIGTSESVLPILRPIVVKGYKAALLGAYDSEIRCAAAFAIGRLRSEEGRELLTSLTKDSDPGVRTAAQRALELPSTHDLNSGPLNAADVP